MIDIRAEVEKKRTTTVVVFLNCDQIEMALMEWARANVRDIEEGGEISISVDGGDQLPEAIIRWKKEEQEK